MNPDDPICLCFHVSRRKVRNFIRVNQPKRASQLSECFGAGTGCGWCRPYLKRMLEAQQQGIEDSTDEMAPEQYAQNRSKYVREGGGTPPPGATPIE